MASNPESKTVLNSLTWGDATHKGIRIPESGKSLLVESRIRKIFFWDSWNGECGMRSTNQGIRNLAIDWNPESTTLIQGVESGIQDCLRFPWME